MNAAPHRSYLFVPGNRPERFEKALASGADTIILDLEDAVPPALKEAARDAVADWLDGARPVVLRVNAVETRWFADDVRLARHPGVAAVMLAKSERVADLAALAGAAAILPLVESAAGFDNLRALAGAPGVQRLAFGAIDFQLDMDMRATYDDLLVFRSQFVLASRVAGIGTPIDSPSTAIDDVDDVEAEARRARRLGFGAKLCIHPKQVAPVHRSFSPTADETAWAERVIEVARASQGAAVALDGKMVDKPVILRAEAILRGRR